MFTIDENTLFCFGPGPTINTCVYIDYGGTYDVIPFTVHYLECGPQNWNQQYRTYPTCIKWTDKKAISTSTELTMPSDFTFEIWVKYQIIPTSPSGPLFVVNDGNHIISIEWDYNDFDEPGFNKNRIFLQFDGVLYEQDVSLELDTWHHIAIQKSSFIIPYEDDYLYEFYINGIKTYEHTDNIVYVYPQPVLAYIGLDVPNNILYSLHKNGGLIDKVALHSTRRYVNNFNVNEKLRYQQLI